MFIPQLADNESYLPGRSTQKARELLEAAGEDRTAEVRTAAHGYIVPTDILPEDHGYEVYTSADRPAVPTEPGTSTNVDEVHNVGQAPSGTGSAVVEGAETAAEVDETNAAKEGEEPAREFDPSKATVDEVIEYLDGATEEERQRVLAAEADGKGRKTIADYNPEGAK